MSLLQKFLHLINTAPILPNPNFLAKEKKVEWDNNVEELKLLLLHEEKDNERMKHYLDCIEKLIKLRNLPENISKNPSFIFEQIDRCIYYANNGYPK